VTCQHCGKRPATESWIGEGGVLAMTHGMSQAWCKLCCLQEQILYAKKIIKNFPKLKRELAKEVKR